jgi:hypothetical protein
MADSLETSVGIEKFVRLKIPVKSMLGPVEVISAIVERDSDNSDIVRIHQADEHLKFNLMGARHLCDALEKILASSLE